MKNLFDFSGAILSNLKEAAPLTRKASALTGDMNSMDMFLSREGSSGMSPTSESLKEFSTALTKVLTRFGLEAAKPVDKCWQSVGTGVFKDSDSIEVPLKSKDPEVSLDDAVTSAVYDGLNAAVQGQDTDGTPFMPLITVSGRSSTSTDRELKVLDADIIDNELTIKFFALLPGVDSNL